MSADRLNIGIFLSSTRENRLCDNVANFVKKGVERTANVFIFDPLHLDLPHTQQSMNFMFNPSAVPDNIKTFDEEVKKMDAVIVVCAEYNWSLPPALTNMLDNLSVNTLCWKPCAIVTYSVGPVGGWRVGMQMRQFAGAVGFMCLQKQIGIACANTVIDTNGVTKDEKLNGELAVMLNQLYWLAGAIKSQMAKSPAPAWFM